MQDDEACVEKVKRLPHDIFIDSGLKICGGDAGEFCRFLDSVISFTETHPIDFVMTASMDGTELPEKYRQYVI